jgi:hypothetical protein
VLEDAAPPSGAFRFAYVIANSLNRKSGDAFPSQETIDNRLRLSTRAVRLISLEYTGGYLLGDGSAGGTDSQTASASPVRGHSCKLPRALASRWFRTLRRRGRGLCRRW